MRRFGFWGLIGLFLLCMLTTNGVFAQQKNSSAVNIEVVSEEDLTPPVVRSLPNWEAVKNGATHIKNADGLKKSLGDRPVLNAIDFAGGTEAAVAPYEAGKLLIVEYNTPQASIDADAIINQRLAETNANPGVYYRRIGNYAAFVFDAKDAGAANGLLDQVKYQKSVRWLGENPLIRQQAERAFVQTSSEIFLSTFLAIALGVGSTVLLGIGVGAIIFYLRKQKRAEMTKFSDAGGMVRLNLDELSEVMPDKLLKE